MSSILRSIADSLRDKKILILGFGREGKSTFRLLKNLLPGQSPAIADRSEQIGESEEILRHSGKLTVSSGEDYLSALDAYDIIFKSPGIKLPSGALRDISRLTSQTRVFLSHYREHVIGVTGTKGKSTTSSLIAHILNAAGIETKLAGNIGIPVFDKLEGLRDEKVVFELSAHQLEDCADSPHVAVYLNLFPEHLDHFSGMEAYGNAKLNIAAHQGKDDYFIHGADNPCLRELLKSTSLSSQKIPVSLSDHDDAQYFVRSGNAIEHKAGTEQTLYPSEFPRQLRGDHNLRNILIATAVARLFDVPGHLIAGAVATFRTLPHRMERLGVINGIEFVNDSIATIPEASMQAVKALGNVKTLIAGGFDRGIDYTAYADFLAVSEVRHLILLDAVGERIDALLKAKAECNPEIYRVKDIEEAVALAFRKTPEGSVCLLSPAAASYGMFRNFEERGDHFRQCVMERNKKTP